MISRNFKPSTNSVTLHMNMQLHTCKYTRRA